ncbi:MAG TPA: TonB-dependent siderophore receptor [Bryobacteraceae bacterium]|nr:TonB-dependent siderophore receptor [Bryobacteraceae bacterium]
MASKRIKKKVKTRTPLSGRRYWVAMGTLAAYSATGAGKLALARQRVTETDTAPKGRIQSLPVRRYAISPADLGTVIGEFEKVSGVQVKVPNENLLGIASPGVSGVYTDEKALKVLLTNTGLSYSFSNSATVILQIQTQKTSVDVIATAPTVETSLPKYQVPLLDTPQTIDVVPQQTMQQQGTTTLRDALRNVAGISLAAGEGGAQGDNLTIRGFTARNDLFVDGMRDFGSYYRDPFNTQEVQVLQGPSSVTFGRGSTGGVVNQATKTPELNHFMNIGLDFGTDATRRATIDLNTPFTLFGSDAAFRLNAMGDIGNVAGRDIAENRRDGFAPSLVLGLGTPTRVTASYLHENADDIPDYGIPWLFNGPAPLNRNNYYGLADGNYLRTYDDIGTLKAEHDINSNVTVRDQVRYANYVRDVLITEAQLTGVTPSTPLVAMQPTRHEIGVNSTETFLVDQLDLTAHFKTGFIKHTFVTGVEGGRETSDPTRPNYTAPGTSLLNPNPYQQLNPNPTITSQVTDSALSVGAYAIDTISLGEKLDLTGGIRYDHFDDIYSQTVAPASHFERVDAKPTWRAAVVYKPVSFGSLYFDAGTSFNPSAESLSLSAGTANLPPESNKTYEFGTKWELKNGRLTVNSSWFRTEKENAREASPTNSLLYVLAGNQRVSGLEADIRGHLTSRWEILSSYAYLDSRVVSSQFYPAAIGYPLANVPKNTFNFWSEYYLPHHFEFGAGANYVSSRTASSTVPLDPTTGLIKQVPSYWVFNAMLSHPLGEHVDVQVNAYNLANRYYYDEIHPAHIIPGPGRSALIGFKFKF